MYWLSGLTCTDENFHQKSGFARAAAEHGIAVVMPDTSPRGVTIEGADDSYDFGSGAGFYVDATTPKWAEHYQMYSYVTAELPALVQAHFKSKVSAAQSICGHSMGGHGALTIALKNPSTYSSVSAFSPICHPTACPWGEKAFKGPTKDLSGKQDYLDFATQPAFGIMRKYYSDCTPCEEILPAALIDFCTSRLSGEASTGEPPEAPAAAVSERAARPKGLSVPGAEAAAHRQPWRHWPRSLTGFDEKSGDHCLSDPLWSATVAPYVMYPSSRVEGPASCRWWWLWYSL